MLTEHERKLLQENLDSVKKEVNNIRNSLNEINAQKESWFAKKEEIGKKIRELIGKVKDAKAKRNELTNSVRAEKEKRQQLNVAIVAKIDELKKIKEQKVEVSSKAKERPMNLGQIKKMISEIERKVETEVMSFEKETVLMKRIRELRRQRDELLAMGEVNESRHGISKDIDVLKKEANSVHRDLQTKADESQQHHEKVITVSKEIDALKAEEDDAYKKFFELKQKFTEANNKLKEKLVELNDIHQRIGQVAEERRDERKQSRRKTLRQKEMDVEENIRRGEKLTTDDILVMQGAELENSK